MSVMKGAELLGAQRNGKGLEQLLWGRQLGIWQSQIPAREAGARELEGVAGAAVFWELCSVWRLHLLSAVWRQKQETGSAVTQG